MKKNIILIGISHTTEYNINFRNIGRVLFNTINKKLQTNIKYKVHKREEDYTGITIIINNNQLLKLIKLLCYSGCILDSGKYYKNYFISFYNLEFENKTLFNYIDNVEVYNLKNKQYKIINKLLSQAPYFYDFD